MPLSSIRPPSLLPTPSNFVLQPSNAYPDKSATGIESKNDLISENRELTSLDEEMPNLPSKNECTDAFSMGLLLLELDSGLGGIRKERFLGSFVKDLEDYAKSESVARPAVGPSISVPGSGESSNAMVSTKRERQHYDSEDERVPKRSRLRRSDDWSSNNTYPPETSSQKTVKLLRMYAKDISAAKMSIYCSPHAPRMIPDSQWERILRGQALDLNKFLWAQCHLSSDVDEPPQTTVQTPLEWVIAWRGASKAVSFAFPHRAEEMNEYGEWTEDLFFHRESSDIPRIIRYDIAVRNEVAGGQKLSLLDNERFFNLYESITIRGGREYNIPPGWSMRRHKICYKFNLMHGCSYSDAVCRYRHVCKRCRREGHTQLGYA